MTRRFAVLGVLAVLVVLLAGCGGDSSPSPPADVTGVIVAVEGEGSDVRSFTLETEDETYEIRIAEDVDYGFDLAHLREHEATRAPVHCRLENRDGVAYARTIEDVPQ